MKKKQNEYRIPNTFFDPSERGEKNKKKIKRGRNLISPSMHSVSLSLHGGGMRSGGGGRPTKAPIHRSTFVAQGPMGVSYGYRSTVCV